MKGVHNPAVAQVCEDAPSKVLAGATSSDLQPPKSQAGRAAGIRLQLTFPPCKSKILQLPLQEQPLGLYSLSPLQSLL